ncbi:MAG TPA: type II secretion system F family protein [Chloroflexota bacterium]|nr:type II secretion system F family protein [Chloroflexota bacterium]
MMALVDSPALLGATVALAILIIFVGAHRIISSRVDISGRLKGYVDTRAAIRDPASPKRPNAKSGGQSGFSASLARDLARADLKLTVTEFVSVQAMLTVVGLVVGIAAANIGLTALLALAGFLGPRFYLARRQQGRLKAFNHQLGDTLMLIANALRSGYSLLQAMDTAAHNAPQPTSGEFARVVREVGLGLTPEQALANLVRRIGSDDLELMTTAVNIQHEVGGNLAQILDTISDTIRERVRIKGEIASLTAQQRLSGYVIAALPLVVAGGLFLINPTYVMPLFSFRTIMSVPIIVAPAFALVMVILGYLAIKKIVAIEV